jgi:nucleoside-diphosphate-sugar epimerase
MNFHSQAQRITFDDSRAEKEWGWKPEYSLEGMVADFYAEMRANPERYR